jgi:hypothetical protein
VLNDHLHCLLDFLFLGDDDESVVLLVVGAWCVYTNGRCTKHNDIQPVLDG